MITIAPSPRAALVSSSTPAGAQSILASAYFGSTLHLLAGASPAGLACCSSVTTVASGRRGRLGSPRTLLSGLDGPATAGLVPLSGGGGVAAIATQQNVWVAAAGRRTGFGRPVAHSRATPAPRALAATALPRGRALLAWTDVAPGTTPPQQVPRLVLATGSARGLTGRARVLLSAPAGYEIGEVAVAARGAGATVAFTESWFDPAGVRHAWVFAADLAGAGLRAGPIRALSSASTLAGGLALASDPRGDEVAAWRACVAATGACTAQAAVRPSGAAWPAARGLGAVDPGAAPVAAVTPMRTALAGWVSDGRVRMVAALRGGRNFGRPAYLSSRGADAAQLQLAAGAGDLAVAAWTQGDAAPSIWTARRG